MKKVAIALGGGGAKFFAHLGMLEVLMKNNVSIDYMACSSMASIAGALVANGVEIGRIREEFCNRRRFASWLTPSFSRFGFLSQKGIRKFMEDMLPQRKIENSKIPFSIVSANILDGKLHIFDKGDIIDAVCASCAFPGIFPPVKIDGKMLVDGGVLNNIPADLCRDFIGKDGIVISSSLDAGLNCELDEIKSPFDVYQRIVYLPMYEKRLATIMKNSDFFLQHFAHKKLSLKTGQDVFKVLSRKDMEIFYAIGMETTLKEIGRIKKAVTDASN